jgi:hypothetical protein
MRALEVSSLLSADELLAGGALTFEVAVPAAVLSTLRADNASSAAAGGLVRLRPLTVRDLQLITRAAKENDALTSALMVQTALVEPKLSLAQVNALHVGLLQFLLEQVNRLSGISTPPEEMQAAAQDPLVRAAFILAREFGWTPEQVGELTLGQIMLHLQLLKEQRVVNG